MVLNDELITNLPADGRDYLNIQINGVRIPGLVSLYEEHDTRSKLGYNLNEWYTLSPEARALEIAIKRIRGSIEYQNQKEEERRMKSKK